MTTKTNRINCKMAVLALASVVLLTPVVHAATATIVPAMGDLILGFRATGAPGQTSNLEVDLGSMSQFYNATPGQVIPLPGLSVQDLNNVFGTSWFTRTDLSWGAVATTGRAAGTPDNHAPVYTLWATAPNGNTAFVRKSAAPQKNASAAIEAMLVAGSFGTLYDATSTTNSPTAALIDATQAGSWTFQDLKTAGTSFGFFQPTVESAATVPVGGQVVAQLYELQPSSVGIASTLLGNLVLMRTGLSFVAAGGSAAPVIGVSGNLAFGTVTTGTTVTATLTIANTGNATLTVTNITYSSGLSGAFSGSFNGTIAAGSATNVMVTFAPLAVTSYSGIVTVNNDATSGTSTLAASGTGKAAAVPPVTITVQANPGNGGTVTGSGTYPVGTNFPITATAYNGWTFTGWSDGNTQSPHTITVSATNFTYIATFVHQTATIGVVASPVSGGTVGGAGTYPVGTNVQITAMANSGWRFTGWTDGSNTNATRSVAVTAGGATYTANFVVLVSVAPPALSAAPVISNSLLAVGNQFVVAPGDTNVFTVSAVDTVDNSLLRYQWVFGDGETSVWSAVAGTTHSYAANNCGHYAASVTVSNTQFAISSNLTVIAACDLTITKLQIALNFAKPSLDKITLTAKLDLAGLTNVAQLASLSAVVDVGDAQVPFSLTNKGRGVSTNGTCVLAYTKPNPKKGLAGFWTATINLSKGTWSTPLAKYGLTGNTTIKKPVVLPVPVPVVVLIGNEAAMAEKSLSYTALQNKSGTVK